MNDREFKKHLQAIARGEEPAEREGQILEQEPECPATAPAKEATSTKKPSAKSKQSTPKLGQVRVKKAS